jgi:hypothetical protein
MMAYDDRLSDRGKLRDSRWKKRVCRLSDVLGGSKEGVGKTGKVKVGWKGQSSRGKWGWMASIALTIWNC